MKQQRKFVKLPILLLVTVQLIALTLFMGPMSIVTSAAVENPVNRTYVFYQADESMLDGTGKYIKTEAWANIPWSEEFLNYSYQGVPVDDFSARFQGMWASGFLYYNIEIRDHTPSAIGNDDSKWTKDGFVLSISETEEGGTYADDTVCRKTITHGTVTDSEGSDQGFEYRVVRDDTNGIINVSVRYTFTDPSNSVAGNCILLDVMTQNNLGDDESYQQIAWHSINGATYQGPDTEHPGSDYLGIGKLSAVRGDAPVVLKHNGAVIALMETNADNEVALPADHSLVSEEFIHGNAAKPLYVTGVIYCNELLTLTGWSDGGVTYTPGETVPVDGRLVLDAVMAETAAHGDGMDVVLTEGNSAAAYISKNADNTVKLPETWRTQPVAGWLDSTNSKLYVPGATLTVAENEQFVLRAVNEFVTTKTGAAVLIAEPTAICFAGLIGAADLADYGSYITEVGVLIVKTDLLTNEILADDKITEEELTDAGITFTKCNPSKAQVFYGVENNIEANNIPYSASAYVELQYENGSTERIYSIYDESDHSRSVNFVATAAYNDRSNVMVSNKYAFITSAQHAVTGFDSGYSPYSENLLNQLRELFS